MALLEDLREALQANSGALPLIPKNISPLLLEYVRKYAPLRVAFPRQTWLTDEYYFNQRYGLPSPQFVQEVPPLTGTGSVTASSSSYAQQGFPIKHIQTNDDVSKFAMQVARVNGSLYDLELRGGTMALGFLEECAHIFGAAQATVNTLRPQWDGLDSLIAAANKIDATELNTNGVLTFPMLDTLIDSVRTIYAAQPSGDDFFFLMSPRMQSKLNQLTQAITRLGLEKRQVLPRTDGGVPGNPVVPDATDPGVEVFGYRDIPIFLSSFLQAQPQMGAVSLAQTAGSTPFTSSAVRKYVVEAVTLEGRTLASSEQSITIGTTGNYVTVSWSTPTITDTLGNTTPLLLYRLFEASTTGAETLLAVVPAYDNNDAAVTSFIDYGAASTSASMFWQAGANGDGATYPALSVDGNPGGLGMESIYLCSRNPEFCVVPTVNDLTPVPLAPTNARSTQFAIIADETLALRAPLFAASLQRVRWA